MDSRVYWIWLQQALSPGFIASHQLLRIFCDAKEIYHAPDEEFEVEGLSIDIIRRLQNKSMDKAEEILALSLRNSNWILTPEDEFYPDYLRSIPALPLVIYGKGELPKLDLFPAITIVGTRESTAFGRRATALISGGLALGGMIVISGGARGIDAIAHKAALEAGGITIAVQGCGLDVNYPKQNEKLREEICKKGAVITEYPPGTKPLGQNFPVRNRIMSGLSNGVCIIEAPKRSGALITARHAADQGRDVFAVAGDMLTKRSPGTDILIQTGAMLITGAKEILEEYKDIYPDIIDIKAIENIRGDNRFDTRNYPEAISPSYGGAVRKKHTGLADKIKEEKQREEKPKKPAVCPDYLSEETKNVFKILTAQPQNITEIIAKSGFSASQVMVSLVELEVAGVVKNLPGQMYIKN